MWCKVRQARQNNLKAATFRALNRHFQFRMKNKHLAVGVKEDCFFERSRDEGRDSIKVKKSEQCAGCENVAATHCRSSLCQDHAHTS